MSATNGAVAMPSEAEVNRAIKLTYTQVMLGSVFGASTGGMFLIGFAKELGANNVTFGLLSTIPQLFVIFQFAGAYLVEKGFSRKRQTLIFAVITPLCWFLVAAIPLLGSSIAKSSALAILIGIMVLVTVSNQFAGSARGSWIGELIPANRRGRFFGYAAMFGGIIGAGFAIAEGRFLDFAKQHGLGAFAVLFFFGSVFGLASALLHVPQPDCPLPGAEAKTPYLETVRRTFRNRPFIALAMVHAITGLSGIAGPFWMVYLLRDVGVSFFGMGVLNCIGTVAAVASAPLWGKAVGKFGCRPVIIISLLVLVPASFFWMAVGPGDVDAAYRWVPWGNLLGAIGGSGLGVSISTFVYKASYPEGRSIQFAMYNTFVTLVGAPMPLVGGALVSWLSGMGLAIDLRLTFLAWSGCMAAAFVFARKLVEPEATSTRTLIFDRMPSWVGTRFAASVAVPMGLVGGVLGRIQQIGGETNGKDRAGGKPDGKDGPGTRAA